MRPVEPVEDVIARIRRGAASEADLRRLKCAIESSLESRLLYQAGRGFEGEGATQSGDDLLIARVAERAALGTARRKFRRSIQAAVLAVAGLCVASAAAAAGWVLEQYVVGPRQGNTQKSQGPLRHPRAGTADVTQGPTIAEPSTPRASAMAQVTSSDLRPPPRSVIANSSVIATVPLVAPGTDNELSASELFANANRARRGGQSSLAIISYQRLVERFPTAPEATQGELALAELLLQRGEADKALEHFGRCHVGSALAEALWGEARALEALNRLADEQRVLRRLLEEFPGSTYAEAARQRLGRTH